MFRLFFASFRKIFSPHASKAVVGLGFLREIPRSLCDIPHSVVTSWRVINFRRNLDMTTHITHKGQTSVSPVGFEPVIPASEQASTHVLDGTATGIGFQRDAPREIKYKSIVRTRSVINILKTFLFMPYTVVRLTALEIGFGNGVNKHNSS